MLIKKLIKKQTIVNIEYLDLHVWKTKALSETVILYIYFFYWKPI